MKKALIWIVLLLAIACLAGAAFLYYRTEQRMIVGTKAQLKSTQMMLSPYGQFDYGKVTANVFNGDIITQDVKFHAKDPDFTMRLDKAITNLKMDDEGGVIRSKQSIEGLDIGLPSVIIDDPSLKELIKRLNIRSISGDIHTETKIDRESSAANMALNVTLKRLGDVNIKFAAQSADGTPVTVQSVATGMPKFTFDFDMQYKDSGFIRVLVPWLAERAKQTPKAYIDDLMADMQQGLQPHEYPENKVLLEQLSVFLNDPKSLHISMHAKKPLNPAKFQHASPEEAEKLLQAEVMDKVDVVLEANL